MTTPSTEEIRRAVEALKILRDIHKSPEFRAGDPKTVGIERRVYERKIPEALRLNLEGRAGELEAPSVPSTGGSDR